MHWLALIPGGEPAPGGGTAGPASADLLPLGWWALQFTPRVCLREQAVLMEVQAGLRLFGGALALHERVQRESAPWALRALAWAPTGLGALALARCGVSDGFARPLATVLDALPLTALGQAALHEPLLSRLGCRTLGEVRRLPRAGLARRCGTALLEAFDQAYGLRPEPQDWIAVPETFEVRLDLPARVESAPALLFGAQLLLRQLAGWLAARQAGVRALRFGWRCEGRQAEGELCIRTASATRDAADLGRLTAEHLARVRLQAPALELRLRAEEVEPLRPTNGSLLVEAAAGPPGELLPRLVERLSARLGPARVLWPQAEADHRPERQVRWQPAVPGSPAPGSRHAAQASCQEDLRRLPQPVWLLEAPLPLREQDGCLHYHGVLQLLSGPHRLETAWWEEGRRVGEAAPAERDYFVAYSPGAGLLWVYRERRAAEGRPRGWFLQGLYG